VQNHAAFYHAIDEIIKYNCYINEFNYMQELQCKLREHMKKALRSFNEDWGGYYDLFNTNRDDRLSRLEIKAMMQAAGMKYSTECEVEFVHNIIASFKNWISKPTFVAWARSFRGKT
jgi:hypothetical protein